MPRHVVPSDYPCLRNVSIDADHIYKPMVQGLVETHELISTCTSADQYALTSLSLMSSLTLDNCRTIPANLCYRCSELSSVHMNSCIRIDNNAFAGCVKLVDIHAPLCETISWQAFNGCGLTSVKLPAITKLASSVFQDCDQLVNISLPNCKSISADVFSGCVRLSHVELPMCECVQSSAFKQCCELIEIELPSAIIICAHAFEDCVKLSSINLDTCKTVNYMAFAGCVSLKRISLPSATVVIDPFDGCTSLSHIDIPKCKHIVETEFKDCSQLAHINLPNTQAIIQRAFKEHSRISELNLDMCEYIGEEAFKQSRLIDLPLNFLRQLILPHVNVIDTEAFMNIDTLIYAELPEVVYLGPSAFAGCERLHEVVCPKCKYIGNSCFSRCFELKKLSLDSCEYIDENALSNTQININTTKLHNMFIHYTNNWVHDIDTFLFVSAILDPTPTSLDDIIPYIAKDTVETQVIKLCRTLPRHEREMMIDEYVLSVLQSSVAPVVPNAMFECRRTRYFGDRWVCKEYTLAHLTLHISTTWNLNDVIPNVPIGLLRLPQWSNEIHIMQSKPCWKNGAVRIGMIDAPLASTLTTNQQFEGMYRDVEEESKQLSTSRHSQLNDYLYTFSSFVQSSLCPNPSHLDTYDEALEDLFSFDFIHNFNLHPDILELDLNNELDMVVRLVDYVLAGRTDATCEQLIHNLKQMGVWRVLDMVRQLTHQSRF